jgi:hypothetical protein
VYFYGMIGFLRKYWRISSYIILLATILTVSCKKDKDSEFPVIKVQSPSSGSIFQVSDTIPLEAYFHDNNRIISIKVTLIDSENQPVLPPVEIISPSNPYTLATSYPIDDSLIESGTYELQFQVFDGINTTNAFVKIQLNALPRKFLYPVVISRPSLNKISAYAPDSSGQWKDIYTRQGDYAGSAINSLNGHLYISGAYNAGLTAFNLFQNKVEWTIPAQQPYTHHWFESFSFYKPRLYMSYYDGYIKAFDVYGNVSFTTETTGLYYPGVTCVFNEYLAACLHIKNSNTNALAIYTMPGGTINQIISPTPGIVALFQADRYHLLAFGNQSGRGIIQVFDSRYGTLSELKQNPDDSIYCVSSMDGKNYILSGSTRLYWYSYDQNSLVEFATGITKARIACENIGLRVFATSGKDILIYSFPEGILDKTIETPEPIVDILLLYNK